MSLKEVLHIIRAKSRCEWSSVIKDHVTDLRIWLQENGEIAALFGLIVGIFVVLFFKLFVFLFVLGGLIGYTVWLIAEPLESGRDPIETERKTPLDD